MSRKLKTNGIYNITCALTGEPAGTTPQVFAKRAQRYGVTVEVLKDNYVGRTGAKLLTTLVNERNVPVADAIKQIRTQFEIKSTTPIVDAVINTVVNKVTAKARKAKQASLFEQKKTAALAKLLGEAPVEQKPLSVPTAPKAPVNPAPNKK